jgi:uncharacterized integral membrane protein
MTDPTRPEAADPRVDAGRSTFDRRWVGPAILSAAVLVPIGILIFSNLDSTEVSWAGFRFDQPLWIILIATFFSGMVGGKVAGWGWRRWRKRRKQLKQELDVLRKHGADSDS